MVFVLLRFDLFVLGCSAEVIVAYIYLEVFIDNKSISDLFEFGFVSSKHCVLWTIMFFDLWLFFSWIFVWHPIRNFELNFYQQLNQTNWCLYKSYYNTLSYLVCKWPHQKIFIDSIGFQKFCIFFFRNSETLFWIGLYIISEVFLTDF